jgi:hypothetical protein
MEIKNSGLLMHKKIIFNLVAFLTAFLSLTSFSAIAEFRIVNTDTGVMMLRDGGVFWNFEIDNPEGRPFFHPLSLPSGRVFTELRPKDHIWHLGYWFCWKYINGINYWEPLDAERKGVRPAGLTRVVDKCVDIKGLDCTVTLKLEYKAADASKPVLDEFRTVQIDLVNEKGSYVITTRHRFEAKEDVVLDRTPPKGSPAEGRWSGGYAGLTLRLNTDVASDFEVRGYSGGENAADVTGRERKFLDFIDLNAGEGVVFEQIAAPDESRFYVWKDKRMVNASPVYVGAISVKKGEVLELAYRLKVYDKSCSKLRTENSKVK